MKFAARVALCAYGGSEDVSSFFVSHVPFEKKYDLPKEKYVLFSDIVNWYWNATLGNVIASEKNDLHFLMAINTSFRKRLMSVPNMHV